MKKINRKIMNYGIAFFISICCVCLTIMAAFSNVNGSFLSTPTAIQPFNTQLPIPTIIALTFSSANTQTAIANPLPLPTQTSAPIINDIPTATVFIFHLQTEAAQSTEIIQITDSPSILATPTLQATASSQEAVCSCSGDTLNCGDFGSHSSAQACFNYCISQGSGDIHKLDGNNDGSACDSLP